MLSSMGRNTCTAASTTHRDTTESSSPKTPPSRPLTCRSSGSWNIPASRSASTRTSIMNSRYSTSTASTFKKPTNTGDRASATSSAAFPVWASSPWVMDSPVMPALSSTRWTKSGREAKKPLAATPTSPPPRVEMVSWTFSTRDWRKKLSKSHWAAMPPRAAANRAARTAPKKWAADRTNPRRTPMSTKTSTTSTRIPSKA